MTIYDVKFFVSFFTNNNTKTENHLMRSVGEGAPNNKHVPKMKILKLYRLFLKQNPWATFDTRAIDGKSIIKSNKIDRKN